METIKELEEKLNKINIELIHEGYHDGWFLIALKSLKANLLVKLSKIKNA